jgi:glycosyltransferase involved in cell wall biosynthesis
MYERSKGFSPQKRLSDQYRIWLWRKADSLITYSKAEKQLLIDHKIPVEKIFVAINTVDTNMFLKVRNKLEETGKSELKKCLGFTHEFNLTFIGRLYKEKRPEILLDLLAALQQKGFQSVAVHYIGEGEMVSLLKEKTAELGLGKDVFFHGAIYDEVKTGEMLFCSDLMIMPGCVGLSVNHAFCFNCPVVTFKEINLNPAHGPEIEYIIDNKTGFQIANHSTETITEVVAEYLTSTELRKTMQIEIKNFIEKKCSVEKMAEGVLNAINYNSEKII